MELAKLQIVVYRKRHYITAEGIVRLSQGFKTQEEAEAELDKNESYYHYWANSISVSEQVRLKTDPNYNIKRIYVSC